MKFQIDIYKKKNCTRDIHIQTLFLVYEKLSPHPASLKERKWSNTTDFRKPIIADADCTKAVFKQKRGFQRAADYS